MQRRESGFDSINESVLHAGANAKTVTSNLPLLTVLAVGEYLKYRVSIYIKKQSHINLGVGLFLS